MWVGVDVGGWPAAAVAGLTPVPYVRVSSNASEWTAAGKNVILDDEGPYSPGGVAGVNVGAYVARAVADVRSDPSMAALEVLNEPGGSWFWGSGANSQTNATAYANLLKAVHEAFVTEGITTPILGSYDGGEDNAHTWGEKWWAAGKAYVDGITMPPYCFVNQGSCYLTGSRSNVEAAEAQTGAPVYITEWGLNTSEVSQSQQASGITSFIAWARSKVYIKATVYFNLVSYSGGNLWGVLEENLSKKPSWVALKEGGL